jgi:hypothetical protein
MLFSSEGIQIPTDGFETLGDLRKAVAASSLEDHVLEKVGDAVGVFIFITGADVDPHADGNGTNVRYDLSDDPDPGIENGFFIGEIDVHSLHEKVLLSRN